MTNYVPEPIAHPMMPVANHDEHAREDITVDIKKWMTSYIYPNDELVYERKAKPKFKKQHGRGPEDCDEVHHLMLDEPYTQMWSSIARTLQEMLWDNQGEITAREMPRLKAEAKKYLRDPKGSLTLDSNFKTPRYVDAVDIHCMPGGYQTSLTDDDLFVAGVYERGAYYYTKGMGGRRREGPGTAMVNAIRNFYPEFSPKRILDVGCTTGGTSTSIASAWPEAEFHAIDVGPAVMRYAHARAECLDQKVHFHLMSGDDMSFPDQSFDLVVSGGVFHETSVKGARGMIKEMRRVLRSGGITMHYDIPFGGAFNIHEQFMLNWDCWYNAEPFWRQWTAWDRTDFLIEAGFKKECVVDTWADRDRHGNFAFFEKPFDETHPSAQGGTGRVQFFGAKK